MAINGILVDAQWCSGCYSCEIACQMLKGLPVGQYGIKVIEIGPWQYENGIWEYTNAVALTKACDLCEERTALGMLPSCVKHCQSKCMEYGPVEKLVEKLLTMPHGVLLRAQQ